MRGVMSGAATEVLLAACRIVLCLSCCLTLQRGLCECQLHCLGVSLQGALEPGGGGCAVWSWDVGCGLDREQ